MKHHLSVDIFKGKEGCREASLSTLPTFRAVDGKGSRQVDLLLLHLLAAHLAGQDNQDSQMEDQDGLHHHGHGLIQASPALSAHNPIVEGEATGYDPEARR